MFQWGNSQLDDPVDIPKATRTSYEAFRTDSYTRYFDDADTTPMREQREKLRMSVSILDRVREGRTYCVNRGDAIVSIGLSGRRRGCLGDIVLPILDALESEHVGERKREMSNKVGELLKAAFGDEINNMIEIRGLATAPEKQGLGYGTALMSVANDMSDAMGRGVFAITTDAFGFYQAIGYKIVQEGFVGADDPTWNGPPIGIRIGMSDFRATGDQDGTSSTLIDTLHGDTLTLLHYTDILKATRNTFDALRDDTISHYLDAVDTVPGRKCRHSLYLGVNYADHIFARRAWTINHGDAMLTVRFPGDRRGPLVPLITPLIKAFDTEELAKRKKELTQAWGEMLKTTFGDTLDTLIEVEGLATAPAKQGLGYGTRLMRLVNAMADAQNRGVYILTSDAYGFYETVGYTVVQEAFIGMNNPTWDGKPVPLRIVSPFRDHFHEIGAHSYAMSDV
ncbi:hypothetical protein OH77DRAFT_1408333 [Trametes cingulata]|nr:hypothetical protein OH77DRAFT_1408333 [Trametes cingulata]